MTHAVIVEGRPAGGTRIGLFARQRGEKTLLVRQCGSAEECLATVAGRTVSFQGGSPPVFRGARVVAART